jgi:hypothetical protein
MMPAAMTRRGIPVAFETTLTPPRPFACASVAAQSRRVRSFNAGLSIRNLRRMSRSSLIHSNIGRQELRWLLIYGSLEAADPPVTNPFQFTPWLLLGYFWVTFWR